MYKKLIVISLIVLSALSAVAKPVDSKMARRVAATFLNVDAQGLSEMQSPYATMRFFDVDGGGFVIVASDDRVQPILGYSLAGSFDGKYMPTNVRQWLDKYDAQIRYAMADDALAPHPAWTPLTAGTPLTAVYETGVDALIETQWAQDPLYNERCPMADRRNRTVTGCVATAMGQIMRYWRWPETATGSHSYHDELTGLQSVDFEGMAYDWDNMPVALTDASSSDEIDAVATLLYHCGVAVDMIYGDEDDGSSALSNMNYSGLDNPCAENALRTYFKYSPSLTGVVRSVCSDEEWAAILKNEIDHARPVMYGGGTNGLLHEFICDGYDTAGFFHFNWGWEGRWDGFYSLNNMVVDDWAVTMGEDIIIGIEPDTLWGRDVMCTVDVSADGHGTATGGGQFHRGDTVALTATATNEDYIFHRWSDGFAFNPYPMLAHDVALQAIFKNALVENNDTLSYTGTDVSNVGDYTWTDAPFGIKLTASALQGHDYLTAVDFFAQTSNYKVFVHRGGDNAPGELVFVQPCTVEGAYFNWQRVVFEVPIPIDDNNLWIIIHPTRNILLRGVRNIPARNANWISLDDGETWAHLNECPLPGPYYDTTISWAMRAITSAGAAPDTTVQPFAHLQGPKIAQTGDTVGIYVLHSSATEIEVIPGDGTLIAANGDSLFFVWDTRGRHAVSVALLGPAGRTVLTDTITIYSCEARTDFPYSIAFHTAADFDTSCWSIEPYAEREAYYEIFDALSAIMPQGADERIISPSFIFNDAAIYWIQFEYYNDGGMDFSLEVSHAGIADEDFTTVYFIPTNEDWTISPRIDLSQYLQGGEARLAFHAHDLTRGHTTFGIREIRITSEHLGITDRAAADRLSVFPNPANSSVVVHGAEAGATLHLFNATGILIADYPVTEGTMKIDVSQMPSGIYFLQSTSASGTSMTRFVVR